MKRREEKVGSSGDVQFCWCLDECSGETTYQLDGRRGCRCDRLFEECVFAVRILFEAFSSPEQTVVREWMKALMKATIARDYSVPVTRE